MTQDHHLQIFVLISYNTQKVLLFVLILSFKYNDSSVVFRKQMFDLKFILAVIVSRFL